jgi:HK97 gp10 family phage protein
MPRASTSFRLDGIDQLNQVFKQLPNQIKDREVRSFLRYEAGIFVRAIKGQIPQHTGNLRKSVGIKAGKTKPDAIDIFVGIQNTRGSANHWHLYAFGTDTRQIDSYKTSPKTRQKLVESDGTRGIRLQLKGGNFAFVHQTGVMPANPVVERVFDNKGQYVAARTVKQYDRYLKRKLEQLTKKYGLK